MTTSPFCKKIVDVENRNFTIQVLKFDNGNFISVSEDSGKLGSMVISLSKDPTPITTTVIPAKNESFFLKLTAEKISTLTKGITIVSSNIKSELKPETVRTLLSEIMEMVRNV